MRRVQVVQHVFAAIILAMNGIDHLRSQSRVAIAEIVAAAVLIGAS